MSEEPEVTIQYDEEARDFLDKKYYHHVIRMLRSEIESQTDRKRAAVLCYEIGRIFEDQMNDLFQASTHYQESLSKHSGFLPSIRALRRISLARGNWSHFVALTDQELRTVSDDRKRGQLWLERAEVLYTQLGDFEETMVSIRKSLELDPSNTRALWFLDGILKERKEYDELVETLKKLASKIEFPELSAALLYEAGRICEIYREDPEGAIAIFEEVFARDPENTMSMSALSRLYYKKKMYRLMIKIMSQRALKTGGRRKARILYTVARILHERLSEIAEAIGTLGEAHQADPESGLIIGEMVRLCQLVGQYEKLAQYYEKQIKISMDAKERAAIYLRLGQLHEENLRNDEKAVENYQKAIEEDPHYLPAFVQLANFYGKRGQTDNIVAMHVKEAEVTESPMRRAMAYHRAAELRESQGKAEEAIELYNKAIATIPSFAPSFNAMERLLEKSGNYSRLVLLYQERLYEEENLSVKISLMEKTARILEERLNNKESAHKVYKEILSIDPANMSVLAALIRISAEQEQWDDHIAYLLKEADVSTDDEHVVDILQRVGEIYEHHLSNPEKAISTYQRLLSISPFYPHAIRNLGRIYHKRSMFSELIELHRSELGAATDPEERSMLLYRIGAILETNMTDVEQAIAAYRNSLMENPRNLAAGWALYRIYRKDGDWMSILEILEGEASSIPEGHQRALALVRIGELWEELLGRSDMAYDSFSQALRMEPGLSEARESLVRLCEQEGNFEYLAELLFQEHQTSVDVEDQYRLALTLGELWIDRLKNPKEAADWFMKALSLRPASIVPLRSLESTFRSIGEWKSLAEIKKRLIESVPAGDSRVAFVHDLEMIRSRLGIKGGPDKEEEKFVAGIPLAQNDSLIYFDVIIEHLIKGAKNHDAYLKLLEAREAGEESDPQTKSVYEYIAGETLLKKGALEQALVKFEKSLKLDPDSIIPLLFLETLTFEMKDAEKNIEVASKLFDKLQKSELKAEILYRNGVMKIDVLMQHEEGIRDIIEALRYDPENEEIFDSLVRIMGQDGRWNELIAILEEISEKLRSPKRISEFFSVLGNLQWKQLKDSAKAIKSLNKVLKFDPHKIPALLGLLDLYIAEEQVNEAIAISRYILSKITDTGAYLTAALRMAELVDRGGFDSGELLAAMENLLKQNPNHLEIMERLVLLYQKSGHWGKAAELLDRLAEKEPETDRRLQFLMEESRIYDSNLKDYGKALAVLEKVLKAEPFHEEAVRKIVNLYGKNEEWERAASFAEETLRSLEEADPGNTTLKVDLLTELAGIKKSRMGDRNAYVRYIQEAFEVNPSAEGIGKLLIDALLEDKKADEVKTLIEKILDAQPYSFDVLSTGVRILREQGDEDRAKIFASLLLYSGESTDSVKALAMQYRKESRPCPEGTLDEKDLDRIRVDNIPHPARRLLDVVSQPGSRIFRKPHSYYGISKSDNLVSTKKERGTIILRECQRAAKFLGVDDYEVYLIANEGFDALVELFDSPAILFPVNVVELSELEQGILTTIAMSQIKLSNFIPMRLSLSDFEAFFVALARIMHPGFGSEFSHLKKVEQMKDLLDGEMTKSQRKQIEEIVEEYVNAPWFDIEEWYGKMKITSYRIALLGCADIGTVLDAVKKREADLVGVPLSTPKAVSKAFMKNDVARDMARFFLSGTYLDLWRKYMKR